eukprot:1895678-Pyramimonas_sp.AAC.1
MLEPYQERAEAAAKRALKEQRATTRLQDKFAAHLRKVVRQRKKAQKDKQESGHAGGVKAAAKQKATKVPALKAQRLPLALISDDHVGETGHFFQHLEAACSYMEKIARGRHADCIQSFRLIAEYMAVSGWGEG